MWAVLRVGAITARCIGALAAGRATAGGGVCPCAIFGEILLTALGDLGCGRRTQLERCGHFVDPLGPRTGESGSRSGVVVEGPGGPLLSTRLTSRISPITGPSLSAESLLGLDS